MAEAVLLLFVVVASLARAAEPAPRGRWLLDFGWRFHLGDAADPERDFDFGRDAPFAKAGGWGGAAVAQFDDSDWRLIDLPHDWVVEQDFVPGGDDDHRDHGFRPVGRNYPASAIGWYRRSFEIPASDEGRRLTLEFDGVYRDCMVWLNGHLIGRNESGYSSFWFDISDYANYGGTNVLVVRADASQYEGWFYEGAGIYRHVWLTKTNSLHVAHWGTYVTTAVTESAAEITIQTRIVNEADQAITAQLTTRVIDPEGKSAAATDSEAIALDPWQEREYTQHLTIEHPQFWSLEKPHLYTAKTLVRAGSADLDEYETTFGIRTIRFDPNDGFFLNGKRVEIKGVCCHQDHAGVGSALPDRLQYFRIEKLKEMGCNAYRTSHNAPTPELLDACDRLGMLVMDEHRLLGSSPEILSQLERMLLRDRNHPSIILWSLGNEEPQAITPRGQRIGRSMLRLVRRLDPTRATTYASNQGNAATGLNSLVDVRGVNYLVLGDIDKYHQLHPAQPLIGTEEASTFCTRGIYANDAARGYVSAYDVNKPGHGTTAEEWWTYYAARPFLAGAFVWTGFDYRGEPAPYAWPCISSHFGIMDTCGFPKDNYYYYQAAWSAQPVLHILPHWNWPGREGQEIDVWVHSNFERVELLLNDRSLGAQDMPRHGHLSWKVKYEPGTLEARGFEENQVAQTVRVETTGPPAALTLSADRSQMAADGEDVSVVTVAAVDDQRRRVPVAGNEVRFELRGPGRILGVGNGDPSCHERDRFISAPRSRPLSDWEMHKVDSAENRPETAVDFDVTGWESVHVASGQARGMPAHSFAVYRAAFELTEADRASGPLTLRIGQIDDLGWVYVNGIKLAETTDWSRSYSFDLSETVHTGRNVVAIVVKNEGGPGGLGRGVSLVQPGAPAQWKRSLFNGLAQISIQSSRQAGDITLTAAADGLAPASATIVALPAQLRPTVP